MEDRPCFSRPQVTSYVTQTFSISLGFQGMTLELCDFDFPKWSQAVTSLSFGEVNALSAFVSSLNHILQKEEPILLSDGKCMSPDLSSSTRKKLPFPYLSFCGRRAKRTSVSIGTNICLNFRLKGKTNSQQVLVHHLYGECYGIVEPDSMCMGNNGVEQRLGVYD